MPAWRERNVRRLGRVAGVVFLSLAAALAAIVAFRVAIAKAALEYAVRRAGYSDARFTVERVGLHEIELANLSVGKTLHAGEVKLVFDLGRLPASPIEKIRVVDAVLGLSSPSSASAGQARSTSAPELPVGLLPMLELVRVRVTVPTGVGTVSVRLDSQSVPDQGGPRMRLDGTIEAPTGAGRLRAEVRRERSGDLRLDAELSSIAVRDPRLGIAAGSVAAHLEASVSGLDLVGAGGEIDFASRHVTAAGLDIGGVAMTLPTVVGRTTRGWTARFSGGSLRFPDRKLDLSKISVEVSEERPQVRFEAELTAAAGRARLRAKGSYDASARTLEVDAVLPRLEFQPRGLQPSDISPRLATAGPASGAVTAKAHVRWSPGAGFSGTAAVGAEQLSLDFASVRIDGVTGTVDLVRLFPPVTAGLQTLRVRELNPAVPFSGTVVRWALEPAEGTRGSRLRVAHFESEFVGGRISLDEAVLDPLRSTNTLDFHLHQIDIARLFELAGVGGVSGTGTLSGSIPVRLRGSAVAIPGGRLNAPAGELHVQSPTLAKLLASGGQPVQLLLDALRNFHYETLTLTVEKEETGEAAIRLHLEGRNPDVLQGRPFRINLNLTGNLDRLTRSLAEVARLSDRAVQATVRKLTEESR